MLAEMLDCGLADSTLRMIFCGGAKLPTTLRQRCEAALPEVDLVEFYGASETSFIAAASTKRPAPEGSVGRIFPGVSLQIRDQAGKPLPHEAEGDIYVKSSMLFSRYVGGAPQSGWFTAGDVGFLDSLGNLHLTGRKNRVINSRALKIRPEPIEEALLELPGIVRAAVVDLPDGKRGAIAVAAVEFAPGVSHPRRILSAHCRVKLGARFCPQRYYGAEAMPLTRSGKIAFPTASGGASERPSELSRTDMTSAKAIVIAARRTAIGKVGGLHRLRRLDDLAAPLIRAVLDDAHLDPADVDEVIIGNAAGGGGNPARLIALAAGLPETTPAISLDRQCASGLDAVIMAARLIETGGAQAVLAGGAESPSTAPWRVQKPPNLYTELPRFFAQAPFTPVGMDDPGMIEAAENVARDLTISRERQDDFALQSHQRALAAQEAGLFAGEIVPLAGGSHETRDEGPRPSLSTKLLARMQPLLPRGTVTAGNSCAISDGAAMTLVISADLHRSLGSPQGLAVLSAASVGNRAAHPGHGGRPRSACRLRARFDQLCRPDGHRAE